MTKEEKYTIAKYLEHYVHYGPNHETVILQPSDPESILDLAKKLRRSAELDDFHIGGHVEKLIREKTEEW